MRTFRNLIIPIVAFIMAMMALILGAFSAHAQTGKLQVTSAYLNNGMKVLLCEDHATSEIYGGVCVHAGAKNDPADATGMAHYLEHMMFKGTDKIGTLAWDLEKPVIDSVAKLYDALALAKDDKEKANISKLINKLSFEAAQYAIPNEVDAILSKMGGSNVNAFTTNDFTAYYNTFPANQLEKWSMVYAERFRRPVFRLFQSELETVYEEYNMYSDDPYSNLDEDVMAAAFGNHPYAVPVIGYPQHIKNPSLSKMYGFFHTYYVPRNMTLILVGNFDSKEALDILNNTWCSKKEKVDKSATEMGADAGLKSPQMAATKAATQTYAVKHGYDVPNYGKLPEKQFPALKPFNGRELVTTAQMPLKHGVMVYRTVAEKDPNSVILDLCSDMLTNVSSTGIIDKILNDNELYECHVENRTLAEAGLFWIEYLPKQEGQTHEQAEVLIQQCLNKLKTGDFSQELFEAVKMTYLRNAMDNLEKAGEKFYTLINLDGNDMTCEDYNNLLDRVSSLTKEQLVAVAQQYITDNYLDYRSDVGTKKVPVIDKPTWKPIPTANTDKSSAFAEEVDKCPSSYLKIQKIDFEKDLSVRAVTKSFNLYHSANPCNDIFTLKVVFNYGDYINPDLSDAIDYFNQQGTQSRSFEDFNLSLQGLGAQLDVWSQDKYTVVCISGFEKDFDKIMALCKEKLYTPANDEKKLELLIENRNNQLKNMREIASVWGDALFDYARYGKNSPYLTQPSLAKMKTYKGSQLLAVLSEAMNSDGYVTFVGNIPDYVVANAVKSCFTLANIPTAESQKGKAVFMTQEQGAILDNKNKVRQVESYNNSQVFVLSNRKFLQSNIYFYIPSANTVHQEDWAAVMLFNEYYGGSGNSVVYQNIRELRSLGYSAYSAYVYDKLNRCHAYTFAYLGTQSDKTLDGMKAMSDLFLNMEQKKEKFEMAREALVRQIESSYVDFRSIPETVCFWKLYGYEKDPRSGWAAQLMSTSLGNVNTFFNKYIGKYPVIITVAGNMDRINKKKLAKFGQVNMLNYSDVVTE